MRVVLLHASHPRPLHTKFSTGTLIGAHLCKQLPVFFLSLFLALSLSLCLCLTLSHTHIHTQSVAFSNDLIF